MQPRMILDSVEQLFAAVQIQNVQAKTYDILYPQLKARQLIPVDTTPDPSDVITYMTYDKVGAAKIISSYADDLPRVDIKATPTQARVKSLGVAYGYNIQEIRLASKLGVDLESRRAAIARDAFEVLVDTIGSTGNADYGLLGLLNQPNAQTFTVPNGVTSGTTFWSNKSPDEILLDLNNFRGQVPNTTNDIEDINAIAMPREQYTIISTIARSPNSDTTILEFFLKNNEGVTVTPWQKLKGAGASATDRMVGFRRDPNVLTLRIPQEFEQLPAEKRNLEYVTDCHGRCAGVIVFRPMAIIYADGI